MGQSTSAPDTQGYQRTVTNEDLLKLFNRACLKQFESIELVSIQSNLNLSDKDKNQIVNELEFQSLIGLGEDGNHPHLVKLLYNFTKTLSRFPLLNHRNTTNLNFHSLLRVIALLNRERCLKVLSPNFDYMKLIFLSLAIESSPISKEVDTEPDSQLLIFKNDQTVVWAESKVVQSFDGIQFDELYTPAADLLEIVTFLLVISRLEPPESIAVFKNEFKRFSSYKVQALSIIKTMNPEIISSNINEHKITYEQFNRTINTVAPNLLIPFSSLFEPLLYKLPNFKEIDGEPQSIIKSINSSSKLINEYTLSQLSTFLPKDLVYSNIRKLYIGSDSGFSMRSFESKVFKWNAPTILLIRGKRLASDTRWIKYKYFKDDFPLSKVGQKQHQDREENLIYGVYIDQPWRITNKEYFGGSQSMIFQMSPMQKIFKPSISAKSLIYFNTLGGGIGFGNKQPLIKNKFKRYQPGNVSLTLDSGLEFAVFRHLGLGGEFKSIDSNDVNDEYEECFMIKDIEVWGCGGEKELEEQNKRWEWEQAEVKRRQQINLKSMGEDRAILEMAGLIGQGQSGGSV